YCYYYTPTAATNTNTTPITSQRATLIVPVLNVVPSSQTNTSIGHRHSIAILNPFSCASSSCSWFKRHIEMDDTCSRFDAEL
ncbi:hypothetical protein V1478_013390, partial [Vespula squamosa]